MFETTEIYNFVIRGYLNSLNQATRNIMQQVELKFPSRPNNYVNTLNFKVLNQITTNLPTSTINLSHIMLPSVPQAYLRFYESKEIDLLSGAEQDKINEEISQ